MQALNTVFSVSPWLGPDIRWEPETLVGSPTTTFWHINAVSEGAKLALIAVARKLLTILNAMLPDHKKRPAGLPFITVAGAAAHR